LNKISKTEFENRHRTGNAAETGARSKGHTWQLRHPEIHIGLIQEAAKRYKNTHLQRSKCEVLSAPALECCQREARLSRLRIRLFILLWLRNAQGSSASSEHDSIGIHRPYTGDSYTAQGTASTQQPIW